MKGVGVLALAVLVCALAPGRGEGAPKRTGKISVNISSPDRRQVVEVNRRGRVVLNGKQVRSGPGKALSRPVWRRDSGAVAFLQRSHYGLQLVVVPELDPRHPLVWQLPSTADRLRKVFWISARRLGVGEKELVPRLVVSWSTPAANLPLW
jgi:hypothetical protein